jgi:hypothetical protein
VVLWALLLVLWPGRSSAQQAAVTWEITAGFDGEYKIGAWFPVAITLSNTGPDLRGIVSVKILNADADTYQQTIDLPNGAKKRIVVPVISDGGEGGLTQANVTLREDATVILRETIRLNAVPRFVHLIGIVSDTETGLPSFGDLQTHDGRDTTIARLNSAALPDRIEFLRAFDALFVSGIDPTIWTDAQHDALRVWVADGGNLIVGGDDRVAQVLEDLLPATIAGSGGTSNLQNLRTTGWTLRDRARQVPLLQLVPKPNARVLAAGEAGQPLLVDQQYGAGAILLTAFDLEAPAQVGNPATFWGLILQEHLEQEWFWSEVRDQGFSILRDSLQLPGWGFISVIGLLGFLGAYILVVGPINYLLLRRLNRREWAYLTIPLWVLLFSVSAYLWGTVGRGRSAVVNQLAIVSVPQRSTQGQSLTLLSLFSPTRTTYSLEFPQNALVSAVPSFFAGQGSSLSVLFTEGSVQVPELSVDVGGMSLLSIEQAVAAPELEALVREVDSQQQMTLRNLSDQRLTDVVLLRADGMVQEVDALEPGAERTIILQPDHFFYEHLAISNGGTIRRQAVVREVVRFLPSVSRDGGFGGAPGIAPRPPMEAYPVPGAPMPTMVPIRPAPDPNSPQRDPLHIWYVLGWQAQAPIEMELGGSPAQADGETIYIWTAQKEQ